MQYIIQIITLFSGKIPPTHSTSLKLEKVQPDSIQHYVALWEKKSPLLLDDVVGWVI